jgi:hypothetical protein
MAGAPPVRGDVVERIGEAGGGKDADRGLAVGAGGACGRDLRRGAGDF